MNPQSETETALQRSKNLGFPGTIPRVIVGTANMGSILPNIFVSKSERKDGFQHLDRILELGCSAFDLAASYQLGGTERLIGSWMSSRRNRDRLFLITKGAHPYPVVRPNRLTPGAIENDLHASLERLQCERVDLYLLHRDDPDAPLEPVLETLSALKKQGKMNAWGVSNWSHARIQVLNSKARSMGLPSVAASSPHFSLAEWVRPPWHGCVSIAGDSNREARAYYGKIQLPIFAWSPLGRGFFSSRSEKCPNRHSFQIYDNSSNRLRKHRAETLGRKYQKTVSQIALAYLFSQPFQVFTVVATSTIENMKSNLEATTLRLSDKEVRWLETGEEALPS